ncbi:MAG: aminotransferase class I/II-fold pyridoxal phosphate-dependent enzyme, partial [Candidatus Hydrogenedentes bacterium]|nr:aminotransferase class I/II-fold pyridoxal phosphate-dependent enzyme [Candidatus Hydrogenedentota bacterium]
DRLARLDAYAFAEVDNIVAELKAQGVAPIDFGVGDPTVATPQFIRRSCKRALDARASSGYPTYIGDPGFREAVAQWLKNRFSVKLDPETEITSTIGSKEAVFHFPKAFVNPRDYVIIPTPGYPPYMTGTIFAEGVPYFVPLLAQNDFLPDMSSIPPDVANKTKIIWVNYPNSPTGKLATDTFYRELMEFAQKYGVIIASDEAYSELYFEEKPRSLLEFGKEGIISFFSMSKRSAMTGWRVGWAAGDRRIVAAFREIKTNIDSGTPTFIQDAAAEALGDERHVARMRAQYKKKRDIMAKALVKAGLPECLPEAAIYIWQRVPEGMTSVDFAKKLLQKDIAVVTTPGEWISESTVSGLNPGRQYVRFALVPSMEQTRLAADRLGALQF